MDDGDCGEMNRVLNGSACGKKRWMKWMKCEMRDVSVYDVICVKVEERRKNPVGLSCV